MATPFRVWRVQESDRHLLAIVFRLTGPGILSARVLSALVGSQQLSHSLPCDWNN